jgi:lipopolysaccharide export system protein LptC
MRLLQAAWERLSLYLPIILMGVLALGTYWLVRNTPLETAPTLEAPMRHEPDYFMRKFSVKTFDRAGRLTNEVTGLDARHFPDTDTLEIDSALIRSFNDEGTLTIATARQALTNADATDVQLFGDARVVREPTINLAGQRQPKMEFRGEFLHIVKDSQTIKSDKPVDLIRGSDRFAADSLDYNHVDRVIQLKGRVKGTLVPQFAK